MRTVDKNNPIIPGNGNQKRRSFISLAIIALAFIYVVKLFMDSDKFKAKDIELETLEASDIVCAERNGIFIIGNPRSLTTSLERYFIRRGDFHIIHEPATRHVFSTKTDIVKSPYPRETTSSEILTKVIGENTSGNFLLKEMAWAIKDANILESLPSDVQVILMIRKPEQAVLSHLRLHKVNAELEKQFHADFTSFHGPQQVMDYKIIMDIFERLNKRDGPKTILLDADELASNPGVIIPHLCEALGITFDSAHLQWESGENRFWPYTDETWQKEVTASTGFTPLRNTYSLSALSLAEQSELKPLIDKDEVIYERLFAHRLQ